MKNRFEYFWLTVLFVTVIGFSGCNKPAPEPDKHATPFDVNFTISDGIRTFHKVSSLAKVSVNVDSEDLDAIYEMKFQVDGGLTKTIRLNSGETRKLDTEFSKLRAYGMNVIEGSVFDVEFPDDVVEFRDTVWMKYRDIELASCQFVYPGGKTQLTEVTDLYCGAYGTLEIGFTPEDSACELVVSSSNEAALVIDKSELKRVDGKYTVPFRAVGVGDVDLTISIINGISQRDFTFYVECLDDNEGRLMGVNFSVGELSLKGMGLDMFIEPMPESAGQKFDVLFFVDEQLVYAMASADLTEGADVTVSNESMEEGHHVASVRVSPLEGSVRSVKKSAEFDICQPRLLLNGEVAMQEEEFRMIMGKVYSVSLIGIPVTHYEFINLKGSEGKDMVSGSNGTWRLEPTKYGHGSIYLVYNGAHPRRLEFPCRREVHMKVRIFEDGDYIYKAEILGSSGSEKREQFTMQSKATYVPVSNYKKAVIVGEGFYDHVNANYTFVGEPSTVEFYGINISEGGSSTAFIDLKKQAAEIASTTYWGDEWEYDDKEYSWNVVPTEYPCFLKVDTGSLRIICSTATSGNADCIVLEPQYEGATDWKWLDFYQGREN